MRIAREGIWDVVRLDHEEAMLLIAGLSRNMANNMLHDKTDTCLIAVDSYSDRQFKIKLLPKE
jgi:hypothetical protein